MRTIEKILLKNNMTKEFVIDLKTKWVSNWCWGQWGFNFDKFLIKVQKFFNFDYKKFFSFKNDMWIICWIHDNKFTLWWNFIDFICANLQFANDVTSIIHWTWFIRKFFVFLSTFFWTMIFWYRYFIFN